MVTGILLVGLSLHSSFIIPAYFIIHHSLFNIHYSLLLHHFLLIIHYSRPFIIHHFLFIILYSSPFLLRRRAFVRLQIECKMKHGRYVLVFLLAHATGHAGFANGSAQLIRTVA